MDAWMMIDQAPDTPMRIIMPNESASALHHQPRDGMQRRYTEPPQVSIIELTWLADVRVGTDAHGGDARAINA
jgi:hypothetical protein